MRSTHPAASALAIGSSVRDGFNVRRCRAAKVDGHPRASSHRTLVHELCGRNVLKRGTRAVEDDDLVSALAARPPAGHDIRQLGMHVLASHPPSSSGVMEVADDGTLVEHVHHDRAGCEQPGSISCLSSLSAPTASNQRAGRNVASPDEPTA